MNRFERIGRYYDALVARYGHDPRACDYGRAASQRTKFEVLAAVQPLAGRSVLDVGCGFADFAVFLRQRSRAVRYTGIDLSAAMVEQARRLHPRLDVRRGNVFDARLGRFDVVVANGIFYLLGAQAERLMRRAVRRLFDLSREAVAFNSLSSHAPDKVRGEYYADPAATLAFCRRLTPWVVLRQDYHARDFTVYMYRSRGAALPATGGRRGRRES